MRLAQCARMEHSGGHFEVVTCMTSEYSKRISNCDICNETSKLRKLHTKWICLACINRINTMIKQHEKAGKTEELVRILKKNFELNKLRVNLKVRKDVS